FSFHTSPGDQNQLFRPGGRNFSPLSHPASPKTTFDCILFNPRAAGLTGVPQLIPWNLCPVSVQVYRGSCSCL
ncbi:hypothetical protein LEMLEM_LOCUS5218, partial [Lemmus lemmus]